MKFSLSLLVCGNCGKPRGRYHACAGSRKGRDRLRLRADIRCGKCHGKLGNPFTHKCVVRTDWAKRRRRADRRRKAEAARERRRQRKAEAAARRKTAARQRRANARSRAKAPKPRAAPHNPRNCKDGDCQRYPCRLYAEGYADGVSAMAGSEAD